MKMFILLLCVTVSPLSFGMTKGELKQALAVLDAAGVPDSAVVKKGNAEIALSPINLANDPGIVYTLDNAGHWNASTGPATSVTAISFQ